MVCHTHTQISDNGISETYLLVKFDLITDWQMKPLFCRILRSKQSKTSHLMSQMGMVTSMMGVSLEQLFRSLFSCNKCLRSSSLSDIGLRTQKRMYENCKSWEATWL